MEARCSLYHLAAAESRGIPHIDEAELPSGAGRTDVSSGSSGSGEAETLDLKLRATAEMAAGPSGQRQPQPPAGEEPTVMVNHGARPSLGRAVLGGLRAGPRRTGVTLAVSSVCSSVYRLGKPVHAAQVCLLLESTNAHEYTVLPKMQNPLGLDCLSNS